MNRITVILLAALDAVIALGVGVAIPLVPLTVAWGMRFGTSVDWLPYWRSGADIWLLGHGVDVTVTLDPVASATFGLSGTNVFTVSIAALGFALLTVLFGALTGRRAWATPHPVTAAISGVVVFAVLSGLVTLSAHTGPVVPSLLQGALLPPGVFAIGIGVGLAAAEVRDRADPARAEHPEQPRLPWPVSGWSASTRAVLAAALRGGVAASALVVAASAVVLAVLMFANYARIVGLYEALQPGATGAVVLTLAQLALIPNAVIWTASWVAGPGFALGDGSAVDIAQTSLGPLPNVPLLGVLPQGDPGFGLVAVLVPVLCGAVAGYLTRQRIERMPATRVLGYADAGSGGFGRRDIGRWGGGRLTLVVLGSAVLSGGVLGLLAWWSGGAVGPARLQHAGPNPLFVAGAVAAEVVVGAAIGIAVRRHADEPAVSAVGRRLISNSTSSLRERRLQERARDGRTAESVTGVVLAHLPKTPIREAALDEAALDEAVTDEIPAWSDAGRAVPARPNAPRVPSPRGRVPAMRAHKDFGSPDFARHESSDDDPQP